VVLTPDGELARRIVAEVTSQLARLPREIIARRSIKSYGAAVVTKDLEEAVELANIFCPEHLELIVEDPERIVPRLRHAGAIFIGPYTPEALGDYLAGPNHILPTGGTARFSSPLGVYDFVKRTSILSFSGPAFRRYGRQAERFASLEGLDAHGRSLAVRFPR
jgi:histidinol dehydrogenase